MSLPTPAESNALFAHRLATRWHTRTDRIAKRKLAAYLAGLITADTWVIAELRAHAARRALWAAEATLRRLWTAQTT